jgi:flagellar hook-length control protein FliK
MLAENGLDLVNVNVSQQGKSHRNGQDESGSPQEAGITNGDDGTGEAAPGAVTGQLTTLAQGLVDFYA